MIIEAALVFGMPAGVNSVGAAIVSGSSFDFARACCDRVWLDFDRFVFGASDSFSSSALFCVTAFAFRTGPLTPLGRTISESTTSCAHTPIVELRISAQRNQIRVRQIMDGKLRTKRLPAQVPLSSVIPSEVEGSRGRMQRQRIGIPRLRCAPLGMTARVISERAR